MGLFKKKPRVEATADVDEARELRADAEQVTRTARLRNDAIQRLTSDLVERRALNHFGDSITITFTRRTT